MSGGDGVDAVQILHELGTKDGLPVEALRAASADRASVVPVFVQAIERCLGGTAAPADEAALFFIFHLLGDWREKSAYRPLAELLRRPAEQVDRVLFGAITESSHRVMAAVFDGDPEPLYRVIRAPEADEFVRSRMCEVLAMLVLRGELPREDVAQFLRACAVELEPKDECFVWNGWQSAIAMLGLVELRPLVEAAFARRSIIEGWLSFKDFNEDLQRTVTGAPASSWQQREYSLFGDTIEELSSWAAFAPRTAEKKRRQDRGLEARGAVLWTPHDGPAVNPFKGVGRNDPCPCGSGKKFKKCCLGKNDLVPRDDAPLPGPRRFAEPALADVFSDDDEFLDDEFLDEDEGGAIGEYDPMAEPDPSEWLALDEQERTDLVADYHRLAGISVPNAKLHAILHTIVENQIAEGDALPVGRKLAGLMAQGLDRHEAIHAIGTVVIGHLSNLVGGPPPEGDPNAPYFAELEELTAESWLRPADRSNSSGN
jgi:hypothetical protein